MPIEETVEYKKGKAGESAIAAWLLDRGNAILPVYEKIISEGKGPTLFVEGHSFIAPDLLSMNLEDGRICWVEAKHKSGFSWHRKSHAWVTGIDIRHYLDYLEISRRLPYPIYLFFLQDGRTTKDSPHPGSPSGLFGGDIKWLESQESHRSDNYGKSGMVYWRIDQLTKYAEYNTLNSLLN